MAKVATIDDGDIRSAVSLHWPDFEDAVQFTAVESAKADYIITRAHAALINAGAEENLEFQADVGNDKE